MKVTDKLIDSLAALAKLSFDKVDKKQIRQDLERMLEFVEKLNELNTKNVEPLIHVTQETDNLREDVVKEELSREEGLKNAPKKDSDYFRVPKVLDKES